MHMYKCAWLQRRMRQSTQARLCHYCSGQRTEGELSDRSVRDNTRDPIDRGDFTVAHTKLTHKVPMHILMKKYTEVNLLKRY